MLNYLVKRVWKNMSLETMLQSGMHEGMDSDKFHLLLDILKILEKHDDPEVRQSAMEIIDSYNEAMTPEQKAAVLKEFLNFNNRSDETERERKRRFDEEVRRQQMKEFFGGQHYD